MANKRGPGICPPSCSILFMFLQLLSCSIPGNGKADFSVFAPDKPLLAVVGEEVDLPCHLSLNISAEDMELRWYRDQPSPAMHLHKNGIDVQDEQMAEYQGRTTFLSTRLAQGQAAVRIHNVTALDNGTFHCNFKDGIMSAETTLWLRVAGLGSEPKIQVGPGQSEGVWAQCTSEGWYPEPQVEWRDLGGQSLPSVTNLSASPTTGLFSVVSNVTLLDRDVEGLSCSIISSLLQRRKVAKSYLPGWTEDVIIYVSPSLDPDTASPKLALSEDGKSVRRLFFDQELPDIPSRFDQDPCVLAREQFSAGKYYWVVQVGHRKAWNLGVCLDSLDPKGRIPKAPTNGLWALELYKETFWALTFPRVRLYPSEPLHQVGILLDCEAGRVSFYNVGSGSLIYTFSGLSFSVPLRPFFCLWTHDPNPLTICTECQDLEALGSPQSQGQKVGSLLHQDP
ncbi:butyrophilin-like protein 10 isoform X2 [Canis lupus baileyi]|uniref:butyrophilin-like protein 10 isoform X2 n=1 Tax=Canis lupus familiaris TaxID=9615 RepID=UPI0018F752B8|nr:butyrophilin-like protein 10 isoform X2 [Canis lupus familiaris]XP_038541963.1 butyrophilin-like protein 10 isoform X2 [Canis lupus familiaris]